MNTFLEVKKSDDGIQIFKKCDWTLSLFEYLNRLANAVLWAQS